jgi:hypothetical protein
MVWQQVPEDSATRCLEVGALGIADNHTDRRPRDFAMGLIGGGVVRLLFLECISTAEEKLYTAAVQHTDLPDSDYEEKIAEIVDEAGPQPYDNDVTLGQVAVLAFRHAVPVHFIDLDIPHKTRSGNPAKRDKHAADLFSEITEQHRSRTGCLVLFGGAHFIGGTDTYRGGEPCLGELLELSYVLMP